jgi:hypothetical protein
MGSGNSSRRPAHDSLRQGQSSHKRLCRVKSIESKRETQDQQFDIFIERLMRKTDIQTEEESFETPAELKGKDDPVKLSWIGSGLEKLRSHPSKINRLPEHKTWPRGMRSKF